MKYYSLRKIGWVMLLFVCTACPVPDVDEYAELTREMTEVIKASVTEVIDFLDEGSSFPSDEEDETDAFLESLENLEDDLPVSLTTDYPKELEDNWNTIFNTLDALVAYSDALAGIKDSGSKGKESFKTLANSLNNVLAVPGIAVPGAVSEAGAYLYGKIAEIKAKNKLQDVITNANIVVQHIAVKLDSALYNMENVNDVAKSKNLDKKPDSKKAQQINGLYRSLTKKENRNRVKIILLNDYDNGDYESLKFFVYEDPLSLDKLGIKDLTDQINIINTTDGLTPQDRLEQITTLAKTTFKENIDGKLTNNTIVKAIDIDARRIHIRQELNFIRTELDIVAPQYHKNIEDRKQIEETAKINDQLIGYSRSLISSWSNYHGQMKHILNKKQKLSLNELKLYINEIKALKKEISERN